MKVLRQTAAFVLFAVALEGIWMLLRVDVLEDLNLFGEVTCWPWFVGAVALVAILSAATAWIRRPPVRNGLIFGILAVMLGFGVFVPRLIGGDGLAVGMLQFLNGYWLLVVAVYHGFLSIRPVNRRSGKEAVR